jgi:hypothetical protein
MRFLPLHLDEEQEEQSMTKYVTKKDDSRGTTPIHLADCKYSNTCTCTVDAD